MRWWYQTVTCGRTRSISALSARGLGLRQRARSRPEQPTRPVQPPPAVGEVAIEVHAAGVLTPAGCRSVGVGVVHQPQRDARRRALCGQPAGDRPAGAFVAVDAADDQHPTGGALDLAARARSAADREPRPRTWRRPRPAPAPAGGAAAISAAAASAAPAAASPSAALPWVPSELLAMLGRALRRAGSALPERRPGRRPWPPGDAQSESRRGWSSPAARRWPR